MATSIPSRLLDSHQFQALRHHAKLVLRALWRRGQVQTWPTEQHLLLTLQARGMFLAMDAGEWAAVRDELVAAGALVVSGEAFELPILSGDWPAGQRKPRPAPQRGVQGGLSSTERSRRARDPEAFADTPRGVPGRPRKTVASDADGSIATVFEGAVSGAGETRRTDPPTRALAPATPPTTHPVGGGVVEGGEGSGPKQSVAPPLPGPGSDRRRGDRRSGPPVPSAPRSAEEFAQLEPGDAGAAAVALLGIASSVFTPSEGTAGVRTVGRHVVAAKLSEHDIALIAEHWRANPIDELEAIAREVGLSVRSLGRLTPMHSRPEVWRNALARAQQWKAPAAPGVARATPPPAASRASGDER